MKNKSKLALDGCPRYIGCCCKNVKDCDLDKQAIFNYFVVIEELECRCYDNRNLIFRELEKQQNLDIKNLDIHRLQALVSTYEFSINYFVEKISKYFESLKDKLTDESKNAIKTINDQKAQEIKKFKEKYY